MAGVAVLHPQDVFINHRDRLISPAAKSRRRFTNTSTNPAANNNNNNTTPLNNNNNNLRSSPPRRKRSPTKKEPFPSKEFNNRNAATAKPRPASKPTAAATSTIDNKFMGHVKILKRGEALPSPATVGASDAVAARMAPAEPVFSPKRATFSVCYAGSACDSSPPPSSLPLPAFFKKKNIVLGDDKSDSPPPSTKDATNDLLKLLRLDLS